MASVIYNSFKRDIMNGDIALDTDTIKVALVTSTYVPDVDAHTKFSDITNELAASGGYTAGGATLTSLVVSVDNTDNEGVFDAADTTWSTATFSGARGGVLYKSTGSAATSPLIGYIDFGSDKAGTGGDFTIQWNAEGIVNLG